LQEHLGTYAPQQVASLALVPALALRIHAIYNQISIVDKIAIRRRIEAELAAPLLIIRHLALQQLRLEIVRIKATPRDLRPWRTLHLATRKKRIRVTINRPVLDSPRELGLETNYLHQRCRTGRTRLVIQKTLVDSFVPFRHIVND